MCACVCVCTRREEEVTSDKSVQPYVSRGLLCYTDCDYVRFASPVFLSEWWWWCDDGGSYNV